MQKGKKLKLIQYITQSEQILKPLIADSLVKSVQRTHHKSSKIGNKTEEPDYIADLVINWTDDFFKIVDYVFSGKLTFEITSIYCHQKPLVDINMGKNPEIGDILFIFKHIDSSKEAYFNSMLLQAKVSHKPISKVGSGDMAQLELYHKWPQFKYLRAGALNGKQRNIYPKTISSGAQYLLIDDDPVHSLMGLPGTFPFGCALPNKQLVLNNDLASELFQFLQFKTGRPFDEKSKVNDDWSQTMWDLIDITKAKASRRKNSGIKSFPRQITKNFDACCYLANVNQESYFNDLNIIVKNNGNDGYSDNPENQFSDDSPGVSLIFIEAIETSQE